jgi:hypothetical protein
MFARLVVRALNRHHVREFSSGQGARESSRANDRFDLCRYEQAARRDVSPESPMSKIKLEEDPAIPLGIAVVS